MVVHRKRRGRGVHDRKVLGQHVLIGDSVVLDGTRVLGGVGVVNAVDVLGEQDHIGVDLCCAQHRCRIGREERRADAAAKEHYAALFQMPDGAGSDVGFGDFFDLQRRLHAHVDALLLEHIGDRHAVHRRGQHAHVVGTGALDVALAVFHAAPEVAAADDDAHLHTHVRALFDDVAHLGNDVEVEAEVLVARQRLAADLEQHALILELSHAHNLPFQEQVQIFTATILAYFCSFA